MDKSFKIQPKDENETNNNPRRLVQFLYCLVSIAILISGLIWLFLILWDIIDKGRLPIQTDPRFIKGWKLTIGSIGLLGMFYGSIFWGISTIILYFTKELKFNLTAFKLGITAIIINALLFYFIFFSELGKWILD